MSKLVILEIRNLDRDQRYPVTLRIGDSINSMNFQINGYLPPAQDLRKSYDNFNTCRRDCDLGSSRKLEHINKGKVIHYSIKELGDSLEDSINSWLTFGDIFFQPIRDKIIEVLSHEQGKEQDRGKVRFIIQTDDVDLWGLPWHLWEKFQQFEVEPVISSFQAISSPQLIKSQDIIRILVILGASTGIDIEADLLLLKQSIIDLNAEIVPLVATTSRDLNEQLWEQNWDILFFAGHSSSKYDYSQGRLALSETESISIKDLKYGLDNAIKHGLKIAIFNSCDGMGLVKELASLQIPAVIAMRERVVDEVAQKFLEYFLNAFAKEKKSLRDSIMQARKKLHAMEGEYPCASWLPMIYEHPAVESPSWDELLKGNEEERQRVSIWRNLRNVLVASVLVTGALLGVRGMGILQALELKSYDQMLQLRPGERKDNRILVIEVTEADLYLPEQKDRKGSLSEKALNLTLAKLEKYQTKVIGLGILYDFPIDPNLPKLIARMEKSKNLIAFCKSPNRSAENLGTQPPPNIPEQEQNQRVGFNDLSVDADGIIRRHLIALKPDVASICKAEYAFSAQLAFQYLQLTNGISPTDDRGELQLGKANLKRLRNHMGGYHKIDDRSYEILLNYRSYRSPLEVISRVTLAQVLNGQLKPEDVKDKIVLIGTTAESFRSYSPTPYSTAQENYRKLPNIIIHAQMVSQLIAAALDERPLIWWWDFWLDGLWIWGWSVVGGAIAWRCRSKQYLTVTGASIIILYGVCWIFFTQSGWVPLIPAGLALVSTSFAVLVCNRSQNTAN